MLLSLVLVFFTLGISRTSSSRLEVLCEKGVLKNFAKFTGKDLCESHFFN